MTDPTVCDDDTEAVRAFNRTFLSGGRVELSIVPLGDALSVAYKR